MYLLRLRSCNPGIFIVVSSSVYVQALLEDDAEDEVSPESLIDPALRDDTFRDFEGALRLDSDEVSMGSVVSKQYSVFARDERFDENHRRSPMVLTCCTF